MLVGQCDPKGADLGRECYRAEDEGQGAAALEARPQTHGQHRHCLSRGMKMTVANRTSNYEAIHMELKSFRDVKCGVGVVVHNFVNMYKCSIGDHTKIGAFGKIQKGANIGKNCKISSHTFICEG